LSSAATNASLHVTHQPSLVSIATGIKTYRDLGLLAFHPGVGGEVQDVQIPQLHIRMVCWRRIGLTMAVTKIAAVAAGVHVTVYSKAVIFVILFGLVSFPRIQYRLRRSTQKKILSNTLAETNEDDL
jgi:site-specific recombinase